MNTAQDILTYAESHDIQMSASDGKLVLEGRLTDEFLESAKRHKPDLLLFTIVSNACERFSITPVQFLSLTTKEDRELILSDNISVEMLKAYAKSFAHGIQTGRITFHPKLNHGI
jgi:hypothetical protein